MSTTTANLGLVKPELTDAADITALNTNWDKLDEPSGRYMCFKTEGTSTAYTVTIPDLTQLKYGTTIHIIPHTNSGKNVTLNVNNLGEFSIMIPKNENYSDFIRAGENTLKRNRVYRLYYDFYAWYVAQAEYDLNGQFGTLSISKGGTGATTAAQARTNLGAASATDLSTVGTSVSNHIAANNPHGITPEKIGAAPSDHNHASNQNVAGIIRHFHCSGGNGSGTYSLSAGPASNNTLTPGMWFVTAGNFTGLNIYITDNEYVFSELKFPAIIFVSHLVDNSYDIVDVMGQQKVTVTMIGDNPIVIRSHYPSYAYGTTDLTPGSSALETGKLHFVYE